MFYVYQLRDPNALLPFYIGKGFGRRAWRHLLKPSGSNRHKISKIAKIRREGREPIVEILVVDLTEADAHRLECGLIAWYGRADMGLGPLTNLTDGGEGVSGLSRPAGYEYPAKRPEVREKIAASKRGRARPDVAAKLAEHNHLQTPESRAKHLEGVRKAFKDPARRAKCATRTGSKHSEETKRKMSEARTGLFIDNGRHISIGQKLYVSLSQAARELGVTVQAVRYRVLSDNFPEYQYKHGE